METVAVKARAGQGLLHQLSFFQILTYAFYLVNVIYFYFYLVYPISIDTSKICDETYTCSRFRVPESYAPSLVPYLSESFSVSSFDLADGQWRQFRSNLSLMLYTMVGTTLLHSLLLKFVDYYIGLDKNQADREDIKKQLSTIFRLIVALVALGIQHGRHSLLVLLISIVGYLIAKSVSKYNSKIIWMYGIFILLFKELYRLQSFRQFKNMAVLKYLLKVLFSKEYGGMYGWQLPANFLALRIISFGIDMQWARQDRKDKKSSSRGKDIQLHDRPLEEYNLLNFLVYVLYAPLYMAGPIITFNSFMYYTNNQQKEVNVYVYAIRFVGCYLLMEVRQFSLFIIYYAFVYYILLLCFIFSF